MLFFEKQKLSCQLKIKDVKKKGEHKSSPFCGYMVSITTNSFWFKIISFTGVGVGGYMQANF